MNSEEGHVVGALDLIFFFFFFVVLVKDPFLMRTIAIVTAIASLAIAPCALFF